MREIYYIYSEISPPTLKDAIIRALKFEETNRTKSLLEDKDSEKKSKQIKTITSESDFSCFLEDEEKENNKKIASNIISKFSDHLKEIQLCLPKDSEYLQQLLQKLQFELSMTVGYLQLLNFELDFSKLEINTEDFNRQIKSATLFKSSDSQSSVQDFHLSFFFNHSSDLLAVAELPHFFILKQNEACTKFLGKSTFIDQYLKNNIHSEDKSALEERLNQFVLGQEKTEFTFRFKSCNELGKTVYYFLQWNLIKERNFFYIVGKDQTHQYEAKQRKQHLAETCHELRNNNSQMSSSAELIKQNLENLDIIPQIRNSSIIEIREYAEIISRAADSQKKILDAEIDSASNQFKGYESKSSEYTLKQINLNHFLSNIQLQNKSKASIKKATLDLKLEFTGEAWISADSSELDHILTNLLGNALKFCAAENGHVVLICNAKSKDMKTVHVVFTAKDNGIGMTEEQIKKLFKPFSQANDKIKDQYGGSGLGLSICLSKINKMGGKIFCRSKGLGQGSEFVVELDLPGVLLSSPKIAKTTRSTHENTSENKTSPKLTLGIGRGRSYSDHIHTLEDELDPKNSKPSPRGKILIVDDNEINRKLLIKFLDNLLKPLGWETDEATNGREALELRKKNSYQLILMDLQMPIMDGRQATSEIRKYENESDDQKKVPIVALTAGNSNEEEQKIEKSELMSLGMDGYLIKPANQGKLITLFKELGISHQAITTCSSPSQRRRSSQITSQTSARGSFNFFSKSISPVSPGTPAIHLDSALNLEQEEKNSPENPQAFTSPKSASELAQENSLLLIELSNLKEENERLKNLLAVNATSRRRRPRTFSLGAESPRILQIPQTPSPPLNPHPDGISEGVTESPSPITNYDSFNPISYK